MSVMPLTGEYEPSRFDWVAEQVAAYERSGGTEANTLRDSGVPIVIVSTIGNKSGKVHKFGLMRVEHDDEYALVASKGGAPTNPGWYANISANPGELTIQDGPEPKDYVAREVSGDEYELWWDRAVAVYAPYEEYKHKTTRTIPIFVASPTR